MTEPICERCRRELPGSNLLWILSGRTQICRDCRSIPGQAAEHERLATRARKAAAEHAQKAREALEVEQHHGRAAAKLRKRETDLREIELPVAEPDRPKGEERD